MASRPGRSDPPAPAAGSLDVRSFGAQGDGRTDDHRAIQSALDAVGPEGAVVVFPPGDYVVGRPLVPKSRTIMEGCHTFRWTSEFNPRSASKVRCAGGFDGPGLVLPGADTVAVALRNLALVGSWRGAADATPVVHGLRMPDSEVDPVGESSFLLEDVSIAGFSGSGVFGRVHVATFSGCIVHNNQGWGFDASEGNHWNDIHIANCYFQYNKRGNVGFGGSRTSGAIDWVNCRFDRAGGFPGDARRAPLNPEAPGVHLSNAILFNFVNCATDANCGNGFELAKEDGQQRVQGIVLASCRLARDGSGSNGAVAEEWSGLKVAGLDLGDGAVQDVKCVGCTVTYGKADDAGAGAVEAPKHGVSLANTKDFGWLGGSVEPGPSAGGSRFEAAADANPGASIIEPSLGYSTLATARPSGFAPEGATYVDPAEGRSTSASAASGARGA